jgi:integrase
VLWPRRLHGNQNRQPVLDWSAPLDLNGLQGKIVRPTAAVLWLSNGVHFMQVSKWLGHSSYVLTMTTCADYIPEQEAENPLPEPVVAVPDTNVVNLFR